MSINQLVHFFIAIFVSLNIAIIPNEIKPAN